MLGEITCGVQRDAWCGNAVVGHPAQRQVGEQEVGVSLDAGDQARLRRIEAELVAADPVLAGRFRRWQPEFAVVPPWVLVVFLVGFTTWMVSPTVGAVIAVVAACRAARHRARRGAGRHVDELWGRRRPHPPALPWGGA